MTRTLVKLALGTFWRYSPARWMFLPVAAAAAGVVMAGVTVEEDGVLTAEGAGVPMAEDLLWATRPRSASQALR